MIAGNPKTGRSVATFAILILVTMIVVTALMARRKKVTPLREPPLHPSVLIIHELTRAELRQRSFPLPGTRNCGGPATHTKHHPESDLPQRDRSSRQTAL